MGKIRSGLSYLGSSSKIFVICVSCPYTTVIGWIVGGPGCLPKKLGSILDQKLGCTAQGAQNRGFVSRESMLDSHLPLTRCGAHQIHLVAALLGTYTKDAVTQLIWKVKVTQLKNEIQAFWAPWYGPISKYRADLGYFKG